MPLDPSSQVLGMMGAGIHRPPFALPVDEQAAADDRIGTVGSVPNSGMDESEALPGNDVEGLRVVRCSVSHSLMLSPGLAEAPRRSVGRILPCKRVGMRRRKRGRLAEF